MSVQEIVMIWRQRLFGLRKQLAATVVALALAPLPLEYAGSDFSFVNEAYADDDGGDDDGGDDDGGGGGGGAGRSPGGGGNASSGRSDGGASSPGRGVGRSIFRGLFRDFSRPRGSGRRSAPAAAPMPERAPNEFVALGLTAVEVERIEALGYAITQRETRAALGGDVFRVTLASGVDATEALAQLRTIAPNAAIDFNHFYRPNEGADGCSGGHCVAPAMIGWPGASSSPACSGEGLTIGLIDTAINADHEAFSHGRLEVTRLSDDALPESSRQHGTAVAALLVGAAGSRTPGLLPEARLIAVDAFHRGGGRDDRADAFDLVRGLDRLAARDVSVINLSLAGPDNVVLARVVREVSARNVVLVAAAGNGGQRAAPSFPAAYDEVIAVTAVDRQKRVYRRAGQGDHIDLAAPGVDVWAAASVSGVKPKTGTSFAAPFVAAAAALAGRNPGTVAAQVLSASAEDLGAPGKDPVFGWGLLNARAVCAAH
jgi:subtilisin family serine protease